MRKKMRKKNTVKKNMAADKRDIRDTDVPKSYVKMRVNNKPLILLSVLIVITVILTIGSFRYVGKQIDGTGGRQEQTYKRFERHYALITDSYDDNFWMEVYAGAKNYGEESEAYLEWTGKNLAVEYSKEELFKIAMESQVDGIILEGDGSSRIRQLIDEAVEKGIPVVTVLTDSYDSMRKSFVGIGSYNLGREYGRQIVRIATKDTRRVLVLMDMAAEDSGQNIIFNGIKETLANEGNHLELELATLAVNSDTAFGGEETIRGIFQKKLLDEEELPDIMICLNEKNTISVYQAAVDYNLVGQVDILGYYVTDTILNAISRNVIAATIAVDAEQMGVSSIKALDEYIETGHVNDFVTMDVNAVTPNNVKEYLHHADGQE